MYVLAWHDNDTMHFIHTHFNEGCTKEEPFYPRIVLLKLIRSIVSYIKKWRRALSHIEMQSHAI
jgi:hypothetical protein